MSVWASPRTSTSEQFRQRRKERRLVAIEHDLPAREGGRQLLRGLWYGNRDPHKPQNYGKTEGKLGIPIGKVVGKRLSPFLLKKMKN